MASRLTRTPIEIGALVRDVSEPCRGGVATFLGLVRDHQDGRGVIRLEYSAYESMADAESERIIAEAERGWPVRVALLHRLGELAIGEVAIGVAVAAAHRAQAFEACRFLVEEVKQRVPIWKKEFYEDGTVAWVDPTAGRPGSAANRASAEISK